ncbi:MAG: polyhydroxyalkanoate synthesis repressor PhaR [Ferrovum sp. 37-45-19]|uniref:polyhydroxyalkanoate synthesis repressor PhaR n=1 Tax=Ferrovum sp. JA12 TaxID=1356299 RepID=UPI000715F32D|nr:polyhydroxyalkanoate synthesis repressor PhaR [Ferrovum sp. JA12]OYV80716.1 MAG: polyhydroxyalkanoate synthesis repressor PhaR [Ferrovum sp. 21-44-67]OYV95268.1 MAG: polyhydroxyalkanoate synthesis repressor PhaR [Ferrovum sp. 37-45-19]OZB33713.1 MAG: polyhydroxyalkanoate synthesis repressor PhaR [Ferrovum sp. 34-44-207]HQT80775.1 polyhydroxyalkanoate synthesis repressor PhaR [Ferrovaceae bacterium]KRH79869.1 PHB/PHA accumulation regulator DNA-binding domain protein [Ferrovum sp. JA12]
MTQIVRLIKKYPNRRLYDTETSSYITLTEIKQLVIDQAEFQVLDARTNQDLTRSVLMQIILEEESGVSPFFTADMLSQMIRSYGNTMQGFMGNYFEQGMKAFVELQKKVQDQSLQFKDPNKTAVGNEIWQQFLNAQAPAIQGLMGNYLEQTTNMFVDMQNQMQKQAQTIFGASPFPFNPPGFKEPLTPQDEVEPEPKDHSTHFTSDKHHE